MSSQLSLLFCDTFTHHSTNDHLDCIKFKEKVLLKEVRIVPPLVSPHPTKLQFIGNTQPANFNCEIFIKNEGERRYERFCEAFVYNEKENDRSFRDKEIESNEIVIRGNYLSISLCVYGFISSTYNAHIPSPSTPPTAQSPLPSPGDKIKSETKLNAVEAPSIEPTQNAESTRVLDEKERIEKERLKNVRETVDKEIAFDPHGFIPSSISHIQYPPLSIDEVNRRTSSSTNFVEFFQKHHKNPNRLETIKELRKLTPIVMNESISSKVKKDIITFLVGALKDSTNGLLHTTYEGICSILTLCSSLCDTNDSLSALFTDNKGMEVLYQIIHSKQFSSILKTISLKLIKILIRTNSSMEYFINYNSSIINNSTGYQLILRLLIGDSKNEEQHVPNIRLINLCKHIMNRAHIYHSIITFKNLASSTQLSASSEYVKSLSASLQEIKELIKENMSESKPEEEDILSERENKLMKGVEFTMSCDLSLFIISHLTHVSFMSLLINTLELHNNNNNNPHFNTSTTTPNMTSLEASIWTHAKDVMLYLMASRAGQLFMSKMSSDLLKRLFKLIECSNDSTCTIEHTDLPSLSTTLNFTEKCSAAHLYHLLIYQLQAIGLLDQLMRVESSTEKTIVLRDLNNMMMSDMGREAVTSTLSHADGLSIIVNILNDSKIVSEAELKNSAIVPYSLSLLFHMLQTESNTSAIVNFANVIYDTISRFETFNSLSSELKGKVQAILDWIKPILIFKEKMLVGLVDSLKMYFHSDMLEFSPEIRFSKSALLSLSSSTRLISLALLDNPNMCLSVYSRDIISDLREIIRICCVSLSSVEKNDSSELLVLLRREPQHLKLLLYSFHILHSLLKQLYAAQIRSFRDTPLLLEILKLYRVLSNMPAFNGTIPPFSASGETLLLKRLRGAVLRVLSEWRWKTVLTKVIDSMFTVPNHFIAGMDLLVTLLPPPLPYAPSPHADEEEEERLMSLRMERRAEVIQLKDRLLRVIPVLMLSSCRVLYSLLVSACCRLIDLDASIGMAVVIEPLLTAIDAEIANFWKNAESSPLLCRLLNLLLSIAKQASGKALLRESAKLSSILPLMSSSSPRVAGFTFAIIYCMCSASISLEPSTTLTEQQIVENTPQSEELSKIISTLLSQLVSLDYSTAACALFILLVLCSHEYGAQHILQQKDTANEEPLMYKFLARIQKSCQLCITTELKEVIELVVLFLHTLCGSTGNRLAAVKKFIMWTNDKSHPFVLLINTLETAPRAVEENNRASQSLSLVQVKENVEYLSSQFEVASVEAQQQPQQTSVQPSLSESQEKAASAEESLVSQFAESRALEERFNSRIFRLTGKQSEYLPDAMQPSLLEDIDFTDVVASAEAMNKWNAIQVEMAKEQQNNSNTNATSSNKRAGEDSSGNSQKKPKTEQTSFTQYTFNTRRDPFRTRKPNTSRPPSTHVDDFESKANTSTATANKSKDKPPKLEEDRDFRETSMSSWMDSPWDPSFMYYGTGDKSSSSRRYDDRKKSRDYSFSSYSDRMWDRNPYDTHMQDRFFDDKYSGRSREHSRYSDVYHSRSHSSDYTNYSFQDMYGFDRDVYHSSHHRDFNGDYYAQHSPYSDKNPDMESTSAMLAQLKSLDPSLADEVEGVVDKKLQQYFDHTPHYLISQQ